MDAVAVRTRACIWMVACLTASCRGGLGKLTERECVAPGANPVGLAYCNTCEINDSPTIGVSTCLLKVTPVRMQWRQPFTEHTAFAYLISILRRPLVQAAVSVAHPSCPLSPSPPLTPYTLFVVVHGSIPTHAIYISSTCALQLFKFSAPSVEHCSGHLTSIFGCGTL